jgi:AbrB family looped-hinge helix DNA binding protein
MARKKTPPSTIPAADETGLGERPQAPFGEDQRLGFGIENRLRLTLGPGGRVVIPAALRSAMNVAEGDALLAWVENGELHLLSPRVGARQAQALLRGLIPSGVSLAEDLIADRRREAEADRLG